MMKIGAAAWILFGAASAIDGYELYNEHYPSTGDAYVIASAVRVAPQVSGQVEQVFIVDHQKVNKGEPLYQVAEGPFKYAVAAAEARLGQARQGVAGNRGATTANIAGECKGACKA